MIRARAASKQDAYLAWQQQVKPQLALDVMGLKFVLLEAGKRLPLVPETEFIEAWLEAAKPVMGQMPRLRMNCLSVSFSE